MNNPRTPAEVASNLFSEHSYRPLRYLTFEFDQGVLTIGGRLPSFHLKQIAQSMVKEIDGVERVEDRVVIT